MLGHHALTHTISLSPVGEITFYMDLLWHWTMIIGEEVTQKAKLFILPFQPIHSWDYLLPRWAETSSSDFQIPRKLCSSWGNYQNHCSVGMTVEISYSTVLVMSFQRRNSYHENLKESRYQWGRNVEQHKITSQVSIFWAISESIDFNIYTRCSY